MTKWFKPWVYWTAMGVFVLLGAWALYDYVTDLTHNYFLAIMVCVLMAVVCAALALNSKRFHEENDQ